jgi:hypothetical protein
MPKIELNKCDVLREASVKMMRALRDAQVKIAREHGSDEMADKIKDAPYQTSAGIAISEAYLDNKYTDEFAMKLQTFSLVADGECPPMVFEEKELVKNILESRLGKIPMDCLKLPYKTFMIELPETVEFPDGSGDRWDVAVIMDIEGGVKPKDNSVEAIIESAQAHGHRKMACVFLDTFKGSMNWLHFPFHEVAILDDGALFDADGMPVEDLPNFKSEIVSKAMLMIAKIIFFITSPSCEIETIRRPGPNPSIPFDKRHYHPRVHKIRMNKETVKRYIYEETGGSGRIVTVRHRVIGHFKHFTVGRLAGRVIWCPPHWRGPEIGEVVEQVHVL